MGLTQRWSAPLVSHKKYKNIIKSKRLLQRNCNILDQFLFKNDKNPTQTLASTNTNHPVFTLGLYCERFEKKVSIKKKH